MKKSLIKTSVFLNILFFLISESAPAQMLSITWQATKGGTDMETPNSLLLTADRGCLVGGSASSVNGDITGTHGGLEAWIVKLDSAGSVQWKSCFGGNYADNCMALSLTPSQGYISIGETFTNNTGQVSGNHGGSDCWLVGMDASGNFLWQKCLGGSGNDFGRSILADGISGYFISGFTYSNDYDVSGNHSNPFYSDAWVAKTDLSGSVVWQKCYGGTSDEVSVLLRPTLDGGLVSIGYANSNDSDVSGNRGQHDFWIFKIDTLGALQWQKCLGGSGEDYGYSVVQSPDSGYVVVGESQSNDSDVTGNHGLNDVWVAKLNSVGTLQWQKSYGGSGVDFGTSIAATADSGYIITGLTNSVDGDVSGGHGDFDTWVLRIDTAGNLLWQQCFGGTDYEAGHKILQVPNQGYLMISSAASNNGDVVGGHGLYDFWITRLDYLSTTGIASVNTSSGEIQLSPNPASDRTVIRTLKGMESGTYVLRDLSGKAILRGSLQNGRAVVNLQSLEPGVYVAEIPGAGVRKLIVARN